VSIRSKKAPQDQQCRRPMETPLLGRSGPSSCHLLGVGLCAFSLNSILLIRAIAARNYRKYTKPRSPKPPSVLESARTSPVPFGPLFGTGIPEHKAAPVVFGAGQSEHKRICTDVGINLLEQKNDSGPSGTSISEHKSVSGGHRTKVYPITGGKPIVVSMPKTRDQDR
jgi:hypothetical protein